MSPADIIARAIDAAEIAWCVGDDSRSALDMSESEKADAILSALTAAGLPYHCPRRL